MYDIRVNIRHEEPGFRIWPGQHSWQLWQACPFTPSSTSWRWKTNERMGQLHHFWQKCLPQGPSRERSSPGLQCTFSKSYLATGNNSQSPVEAQLSPVGMLARQSSTLKVLNPMSVWPSLAVGPRNCFFSSSSLLLYVVQDSSAELRERLRTPF